MSSNSAKLLWISRDGAIRAPEAPNTLSRVTGASNQQELSRNSISYLGPLGCLATEEELVSPFPRHPQLLLSLNELRASPLARWTLLYLPLQRCNTTMEPPLYVSSLG